LDVLKAVVEELFIPEAVWIRRIHSTDTASADSLPSRLHAGERQAIALAKELKLPLLVDEREARKIAHVLGIPFLGSLRVLREAKRRGAITETKPLVHELTAAGMYISDAVLRDFFAQLGES
jgi:predicted nucleic acid-binding protein